MATVEEYTDPHLEIYTPPPPIGEGVCDVCHGVPNPGHKRCWSCTESVASVSNPTKLVVPISWYVVGEQLHSMLRSYKDSPDATARSRYQLRVAATLHRFFRDHGACVEAAAGAWDVVTIVPSKSREGEHPLEGAIKMGKALKRQYTPLLTRHMPERMDRVYGSDDAFRSVEPIEGARVLLLDDTFTSGATFQSAASALTRAGANVVGGVVVGRVITTGDPRYPARDDMWDRQRKVGFTFDRCCLEP